jgi:hypothetical protein
MFPGILQGGGSGRGCERGGTGVRGMAAFWECDCKGKRNARNGVEQERGGGQACKGVSQAEGSTEERIGPEARVVAHVRGAHAVAHVAHVHVHLWSRRSLISTVCVFSSWTRRVGGVPAAVHDASFDHFPDSLGYEVVRSPRGGEGAPDSSLFEPLRIWGSLALLAGNFSSRPEDLFRRSRTVFWSDCFLSATGDPRRGSRVVWRWFWGAARSSDCSFSKTSVCVSQSPNKQLPGLLIASKRVHSSPKLTATKTNLNVFKTLDQGARRFENKSTRGFLLAMPGGPRMPGLRSMNHREGSPSFLPIDA